MRCSGASEANNARKGSRVARSSSARADRSASTASRFPAATPERSRRREGQRSSTYFFEGALRRRFELLPSFALTRLQS